MHAGIQQLLHGDDGHGRVRTSSFRAHPGCWAGHAISVVATGHGGLSPWCSAGARTRWSRAHQRDRRAPKIRHGPFTEQPRTRTGTRSHPMSPRDADRSVRREGTEPRTGAPGYPHPRIHPHPRAEWWPPGSTIGNLDTWPLTSPDSVFPRSSRCSRSSWRGSSPATPPRPTPPWSLSRFLFLPAVTPTAAGSPGRWVHRARSCTRSGRRPTLTAQAIEASTWPGPRARPCSRPGTVWWCSPGGSWIGVLSPSTTIPTSARPTSPSPRPSRWAPGCGAASRSRCSWQATGTARTPVCTGACVVIPTTWIR
ncbi:hypothetical protein [Alloactinosynnema sp. L-07]|nr:hypothetical protein [Alloactinosynnema sp. L-07]